MTNAERLEQAYRDVGQTVVVREIGWGRYEVNKPRHKQTITHNDLFLEIDRLKAQGRRDDQ